MDIRGGALPEGRGWRATRSALYLRTGLGYDDWVRVGRNVTTVADSAAWWLGDWLIFGRPKLRSALQGCRRLHGVRLPDVAELRLGGITFPRVPPAGHAQLRPPR